MRPTNTLKSLLVHPKDKRDNLQTSKVVYEVLCQGCEKSYVGETGRQLGVRLKEHQKDTEKISDKKFTRATRKLSTTEQHKSAITDHVAQENHVIDWDNAKILDRDSNSFTRKVREAIQIRTRGTKALNRDDGVYFLDHVYNPLLKRHQLPGNETTSSRAPREKQWTTLVIKTSDCEVES